MFQCFNKFNVSKYIEISKRWFVSFSPVNKQYFTASQITLTRLPKQCIELYNHTPKYEILSNGKGVIFYPSSHLTDNDLSTKIFHTTALVNSIERKSIIASIQCNKLEATFDNKFHTIRYLIYQHLFLTNI